jgi:hypothetical protein
MVNAVLHVEVIMELVQVYLFAYIELGVLSENTFLYVIF